MLVCDYCGSEFPIEADPEPKSETQETLEGFDFRSFLKEKSGGSAQELPVYACSSCGAEIVAAGETVSLTCPYCRNNIVLTDQVTGRLRPDGIIPFQISADRLPELLSSFYKDKVLMPGAFFSRKNMSGITGVYLPFWLFDSRMSGRLTYSARTAAESREGDYDVTRTSHYRLVREVTLDIHSLPVDASGKLDDALMDSLEPFDLSEMKPFDARYLAGYAADRFDAEAEGMQQRAEKRMLSTAYAAADREAESGYDSADCTGGRLRAELQKVQYALFPVYLFSILFAGEKYAFAVNGQTGKVVGNVPTDRRQCLLYFLKRALIPVAAVLLIAVITYFLGW